MTTALENCLSQIEEAFRPERKEWQDRITQACRVKQLVTDGRYTLDEALEKCEARVDWMLEAFDFKALDNIALNEKYATDAHRLMDHERSARDWLLSMERVAA